MVVAKETLFEQLRHLRLLLVEDDESVRQTLALFFANEGCRLEARESAEDALELVRQRDFDVVLADFRLPGKSGLDFFRSLQRLQPGAMKVLLSAYMNEQVLSEAFRVGVHEFIEKPLTPDDIEDALIRVLARRNNQ